MKATTTRAMRRRERSRKRNEAAGRESERARPVQALTKAQGRYLTALNTEPMVVALGPAGTGKSYVAASFAADLLRQGKVSKVILCRPAVAVEGEEHGFLPGKLEHKMAPWTAPILAVFRERFGGATVEDMVAKGTITVVPFAFMRGLTFKDAFVLLDEAQNTTPNQVRLFLSRLGENVRVAMNGDLAQSDLRVSSGLLYAIGLTERYTLPCTVVEFEWDDVVRSGLCKAWLRAFALEDKRTTTGDV